MAGKKAKGAESRGNTQSNTQSPPAPRNKRHDAKLTPEMEARKFVPGTSGNPNGRPKSVFRTAFLKVLDKPIPGDKEGRTYADAIAEKIVAEAAKGKIDALRELADRVDGKPVQALTHGGEGGGPIPIELRSPEEVKARLAELIAKATVKDGKRSPKAR